MEIEKSEYDRLKSREEKLMAYYEWFVDKENDLATVEDIVNKNIELEEENKKLKECNKSQSEVINNVFIPQRERLEEENRKLKEELAHYKNTEAIQKSNNASRYNPYNHKSYVDREFNVIN